MKKRIYFLLGIILVLIGRTKKFINYKEFIIVGEIILLIVGLFVFIDIIKFIDKKFFNNSNIK
ncbi:hypothetical protein [uncultured Anaerococcus sp.]|uniref:hypothetical protein n=1 Tax=uncultured Anaerococcus sp. TaxID=293428 RepID=UPI00288C04F8|nr:hypothetical protein [uncultured Anaerococcus sp.]